MYTGSMTFFTLTTLTPPHCGATLHTNGYLKLLNHTSSFIQGAKSTKSCTKSPLKAMNAESTMSTYSIRGTGTKKKKKKNCKVTP